MAFLPYAREISAPVNHSILDDQFSDMVCFDNYLLALQLKTTQLVVFDRNTKQVLNRIFIPAARLSMRGLCVDEKNARVFVCTTLRLFCISTHDIVVLKDPVVTEIDVEHLFGNRQGGFSGTMGTDSQCGQLYLVVADGWCSSGVDTHYSIVRIDQANAKRVAWIKLKGYTSFQICTLMRIGANMLAFTNTGLVLFIDEAGVVWKTQAVEKVYSLYKAMYDSTQSILYVTNLKMDHVWIYKYVDRSFVYINVVTVSTQSVFPTPICISPSCNTLDVFDNSTGLFREWSIRLVDDMPVSPEATSDTPPFPAVFTVKEIDDDDDYRVFGLTYDDICDFCDNVYDIDLSADANTEYALDCVPSSTPIDEISSDFFERGRSSDSDEHISVMMPAESPYITLALSGKILPDFSFKTSDQEEGNSIRRSGKRLKREFEDDDEYVAPLVFKPFGSFLSFEGDEDYRTTHLVSVDFPCN